MNKTLKTLSLLLLTSFSALTMTACGNKDKKVEYNYDNFYGICALTGENGSGVDKGLTNEWTAKNIKAMGFKSQRVWLAPMNLFVVDDYDNLTVVNSYYTVMKDHFQQSKKAGIKNFLMVVTAFLYPKECSHSTGLVVPDPEQDKDMYVRWLKLQAKGAAEIVKLFPEITLYEICNEPDFKNSSCIHRDGYKHGGTYSENADYCYTDEVKCNIIADTCWYTRKAIREVTNNVKVVLPGLTNLDTTVEFLDTLYLQIESHTLPVATPTSDTNPDNYFDVLNWHPYSKTQSMVDDEWVDFQLELHQVAVNHGDGDKETIFSELGWSSMNLIDEEEKARSRQIGLYAEEAIRLIKENMPWVTSVYYFRLTNLYYQIVDATGGEENFGLFYHPDEPIHKGAPREAAYAVSKIINGPDYDLDAHLNDYYK